MAAHALELSGVTTGYGKVEVLHDLWLSVPAGSVVALIGPNGAGKTTTLRALAGTLPVWRGSIALTGQRIDGLRAVDRARRGLTLIPEGRGVFPGLSVRDNLDLSVRADRSAAESVRRARLDDVLETFPRLRERLDQRAGTLSGGEQQMLALSRALLADPKVLLMDELSMGLAPKIVEQLFETVGDLKARGLTILLVEQYLTYALRYADICYVLSKGRVSFIGEPAELRDSDELSSSYLGASVG
jgi:branched-chain amino acid transport system ATP-binding protein